MQTANLVFDVPNRLAEVLDRITLFPVSKEILDSVPDTEVFGRTDLDRLNAARMRRVVRWMVDWVRHAHNLA